MGSMSEHKAGGADADFIIPWAQSLPCMNGTTGVIEQ